MHMLLALALTIAALAAAPAPPNAEPPLPTWEEIQKVRWVTQKSVDFLAEYRQLLSQSSPAVTEKEALTLANESATNNEKILGALGRLPVSDDEVDWDATFKRVLTGDPTSLNPVFQTSGYEATINELLFAVIPITADWKLNHFGDLEVIESWETSEDRLMDKVVFRDDLTWSDGTPLTAHDVEFSFKVIMDARIRVPAYRSTAEGLRAVKAYDARTVVYFHKAALATNFTHLAWPTLPRHLLAPELVKDPTLESAPFNRAPVTNGPYRLVSWRPKEEIVLERRDEWYRNASGKQIRAKPYFKTVRFKILPDNTTRFQAFVSGEIEETQLDSGQWTRDTLSASFKNQAVKVRCDDWSFAFIGWNARSNPPNPFFNDHRVRRALALALDYKFILDELYFGLCRPGVGVFHPDSWMASKDLQPIQRDLDLAEELLEQAGWKDSNGDGVLDKMIDGKLVPFEFTVSYPNAGTAVKVAEQMVPSLEKIGVRCRLELVDQARYMSQLKERKYQCFLMMWSTGTDPDTSKNLWTTAAIEGGRNYVGFSHPRVDELFAQGQKELDRAKRAVIYQEIGRILDEQHPVTVLFYQPTLWAYAKSIRGFHGSPRGFYRHSPGFFSVWKQKSLKTSRLDENGARENLPVPAAAR